MIAIGSQRLRNIIGACHYVEEKSHCLILELDQRPCCSSSRVRRVCWRSKPW